MRQLEPCKTIIAGSRSITSYDIVKKCIIDSGLNISEIVCGKASGVDNLGEKYAIDNDIPISYFPADWNDLSHSDAIICRNKYGYLYDKKAGMRRNLKMAEYADALIAIWDGRSKGTKAMIEFAVQKNLIIYHYNQKGEFISCRGIL